MIDFGQAVERGHPDASVLLQRDLSTMRDFFAKQGIKVLTDEIAEEFVLAPIEGNNDVMREGLEQISEEAACENKKQEGEGDSKSWRHSIPGWNDEKCMETLLARLKAC